MVPPENIFDAARARGSRAVLEDAVRLHQQGNLAQAERLYGEVLARDPGNADALHLLGMIGLQRGEARAARDLIRKAIAINDRVASYHFHHALALQSLDDMQGAVDSYRRALALKPDDPDTYNNMGNALAAQGRLKEALQAFHRLLALQPGNALAHNNLGHVQKSLGRGDEAEASFRKAIALQPGYAGALVNLGNLHHDRNETDLAEDCYRRALALAPHDASAHCGLGAVLWRQGRHDQAMACYRTALSFDPHHAGALVNLGNAHWERGALAQAEALHARALAVRPQDCEILNSLTALRLARGDSAGAGEMIRRSLAVAETLGAKRLFVRLARRADWNGGEQDRHVLARALAEPWDRPGALAEAAARLIRAHPAIGPLVAAAEAQWPNSLPLAQLLGDAGFTPLADDALLRALLTSAPNMDIPLERFLTLLRRAMLRELAQDASADGPVVLFASALAQQCFINEYVFSCGGDEMAAARTLLETADAATPMRILLAACYCPLHRLPGAARLLETPWPPPVDAVLTQQMREPAEEQRLRAQIPRLTPIADAVSLRVQDQYEENPYPRWVRQAPGAPDTILNFIGAKFPLARFDRHPGRAMQDVLIAGCGTGQRAIAMAQKFGGRNILAVDLSLASLCYARRKSEALGLPVTYGQADLLELGRMERQFDLIESLGVLHHLADPWEGWRRLLALLRPGGFMLLGLYSESARRPIAQVRARIREQGLGGNAGDIRRFRQALIGSGAAHPSILSSEDFFSLSACRDLLFHVQEHHATLAAIARFIKSERLHFLGFELDDAVLAAYRNRFPQDRAAADLACWETFEADHPGLFGGMYVFWIQKPADAGTAETAPPLPSEPTLLQSSASDAAREKPAPPPGTVPET